MHMKNVYALLFVVQGLVWGDIVEVSNFEEIKSLCATSKINKWDFGV